MISNKRSLLALVLVSFAVPVALGAPGEVLILQDTVGFASPSLEESVVTSLGRTPVLCDNACWAAKTTAEFADYDALILGDPTCTGLGPEAAATANAAVWSAAVTGKVSIWGTDPTYHSTFGFGGDQGGNDVAEAGIAFAVSDPQTGAYITTSCYYDGAAPNTPVAMLAGFGLFEAQGAQCWNASHIVAVHPALAALTDARLSNWSCSAHNFFNSWPVDFIPLVISEGVPGGTYMASDGTIGGVYVLARGAAAVGTGACCDRTALSCTDNVFEADCMPPLVWYDGVVCDDVDPPCEPPVAVCGNGILEGIEECDPPTDPSCDSPRYCSATCTVVERPVICGDGCVDDGETCDDGNTVDGDGCPADCTNEPPDCSAAAASLTSLWPPNHKYQVVSVVGVTDPDGDAVTVTVGGVSQDESVDAIGKGDGNTCPDALVPGGDSVSVRAERQGTGNGRVYHIDFSADDGNGGACSGAVTVCVPHDQGNGNVCVDEGALYDSTVCP